MNEIDALADLASVPSPPDETSAADEDAFTPEYDADIRRPFPAELKREAAPSEKQRATAVLNQADDESTWSDLELLYPVNHPRFSPEQIALINRRVAEIDSGTATLIPHEEVMKAIRAELAARRVAVS